MVAVEAAEVAVVGGENGCTVMFNIPTVPEFA
jgi:hypothetical protein